MHEKNAFITLTYSDEHLASPKLIYEDFQLFMKKLRNTQDEPIGYFVTGEYGEKTKRPHWHAIVFNWYPRDATYSRSNDLGDALYSSEHLDKLWGKGKTETGAVTFRSAGYCARYAAKKLVHGEDQTHDYHPISKKSSKHAIGKKWLEKNWRDVFIHGNLVLDDGTIVPIPRYYEKWLEKNQPEYYVRYVTKVKAKKILAAQSAALRESTFRGNFFDTTKQYAERIIQKQNFKRLQNHLKL